MLPEPKISKISFVQYGFLAVSLGFSGFPIYILVPDFYAINYGMNLSTLGFCLLLIRIVDAFQDPMIGILSDRYRHRIILIMGLSACILVLSIYILFNLSLFSPLNRFIVFMTLSVTAYSVLTINLNSVCSLWLNQSKFQVKVSSVREVFALIGLLVAVSIPHLLEKIVDKKQIYQVFVLVLFTFISMGFFQFYIWYKRYSHRFNDNIGMISFNIVKISKSLKQFFIIYFLSMFASSIPAVLVIFFVRDFLGVAGYTGLFLLIYFISAAIFIPFWIYVSNNKGKYQAWLYSMLLASFSFIWAFFLTKGDVWQYAVICFISGIALGGDLVFPPAIVSDYIHKAESNKNASYYFGILNLLAKSSLAFASALSFFALDYAKFKVGGENLAISLKALIVAYALIPCIIKIISAFFIWKIMIKSSSEKINENI